ncbi:MATE family efflux transporter [Vibrio sp. FNV 38]|nr:MATE family efflux transporter [Vibrio sp. FNV 38]
MSSTSKSLERRMNIVALTWPIFIETLLRSALGVTDVFMLSGYSDLAVSAVGVVSQIVFFLIVMSLMVSSGTGILIAQYNGAQQTQKSAQVGLASMILGMSVGLLLSALMFFGANTIVGIFGLEPAVAAMGLDYFVISGIFTFNLTFSVVLTTILRSYGYSRSPMVINLIAGLLNIIGNYIALYQPFGIPVYGITGVAIATVFSQMVTTVLLIIVLRRTDIHFPFQQWRQIPISIYRQILRIGVLNGGEILSYNLAQIALIYIVVQLGTASLAAYTYAQNITRVTFTFALALGQATQIQTSYFVGKQWLDEILGRIHKYYLVGLATSLTAIGTVILFRESIINLFTQDPEITALLASLLFASLLIESGRVGNLIFISALKGAGDISFTVKIAILVMWGVSVTLGYLLGLHWGMGALGVWLAIAADEWIRSVIMFFRWRSMHWKRFSLVSSN